jgi:hypothetical protein
MKKFHLWIVILSATCLMAGSCSPSATYERRLKKELASGVRYDSLFLGITMEMTPIDFYSHCWKLNKDSLIKQGDANMTVQYALKEELKAPATMNFYPTFAEEKIIEMPVNFVYNGWTPWNKSLSADSLQYDVLEWYKEVYGKDFITAEHSEYGKAFIHIRGNRRITIYKEDEMNVRAIFKDMSFDPENPNPADESAN